jgi:hypothetical protein
VWGSLSANGDKLARSPLSLLFEDRDKVWSDMMFTGAAEAHFFVDGNLLPKFSTPYLATKIGAAVVMSSTRASGSWVPVLSGYFYQVFCFKDLADVDIRHSYLPLS